MITSNKGLERSGYVAPRVRGPEDKDIIRGGRQRITGLFSASPAHMLSLWSCDCRAAGMLSPPTG